MWDDEAERDQNRPQPTRAKVITLAVAVIVVGLTMVLCCSAVGDTAELFQIGPVWPR